MSNNFQITRRLEIDAAHRVPDHRSKCFNIHGHRYVIEATCEGPTLDGEQEGMVMDFGFLKQCMIEVIHNSCDHGTIFYYKDPMLQQLLPDRSIADLRNLTDTCIITATGWKIYFLDCVPTAENLAKHWHEHLQVYIQQFFDSRVMSDAAPELVRIDVWETPNCIASYPA